MDVDFNCTTGLELQRCVHHDVKEKWLFSMMDSFSSCTTCEKVYQERCGGCDVHVVIL